MTLASAWASHERCHCRGLNAFADTDWLLAHHLIRARARPHDTSGSNRRLARASRLGRGWAWGHQT